jgi:translation initiation factor 1
MRYKTLSDLQQLLPAQPESTGEASSVQHDGKGKSVRILLDTKGRKGKTVTIVDGLQHNPATMKDIARILKEHCGTGGTIKDRTIELQGDQRTRAVAKLSEMHYIVKVVHS